MINFRTDLALERRDLYRKANNIKEEIPGIETEEEEKGDNKITRVKITNLEGANAIGKPVGNYITIDIKNLRIASEEEIQSSAEALGEELKKLYDIHLEGKQDILVVGLGNMGVTPDALRTKCSARHRYNKAPIKICTTILRRRNKTSKCNSPRSIRNNWNRNTRNIKRNSRQCKSKTNNSNR